MATSDALKKPFAQLGASGLRQFSGYVREEFLRQLIGWRGTKMYREMRDNDPVIGAMFFAMERLIMSTEFTVKPATDAPADKEAADFVNSAIADMEMSWPELISEILTFLQYGYSVHEIVYKRRNGQTNNPMTRSKYDDGMIGWRKIAMRAQETLLHWNFDDSGEAVDMVQLLPTGGPLLAVPLAKCLHFRTRLLKNNPEGVSLLRNCYVPYYRKKRIEESEAVGIERDLCGLPVAMVPARLLAADANDADRKQLEVFKAMVRDTVRNDQEGFVIPSDRHAETHELLYEIKLLTTGGRRQIDTSTIVDRYDHRILSTWLADFITLGSPGSAGKGGFAQSKNKTGMFAVAVASFLDVISNEFNRKAIPDLLALNQIQGACQMQHGSVTESDITDFSQALLQAFQAMSLTPDARTEAAVRGKLGLPPQIGVSEDDLSQGGAADAEGDEEGETTDSGDEGGEDSEGQGAGADPADTNPPPGSQAKPNRESKAQKAARIRKRRRKRA